MPIGLRQRQIYIVCSIIEHTVYDETTESVQMLQEPTARLDLYSIAQIT